VNVRASVYLIVTLAIAGCHDDPKEFANRAVTRVMLDKAREEARAAHKTLMVEFGANWCSECRELSNNLECGDERDYLRRHFAVLKVDVGEFNRNLDAARSLGIDVTTPGIPAAVFFPHDAGPPVTKFGSSQILAFLAERRRSNPN
jgi:thiol:disulfide interchange protein